MSQTPGGWHPDSEQPGMLRYWDGKQWTEHRRPSQQESLGLQSPNNDAGAEAGWWADPEDPTKVRFWDGQRWTDSRLSKERRPHNRKTTRKNWFIGVGIGIGALLFVGSITGGDGDSSRSDLSVNDQGSDRYTQTWAKSYSETTCAEWTDMSSQQQFAAAADMLASARNRGDGGSGLPPDSLIETFGADIGLTCSESAADSWSLAEVGATLYLTERDLYSP